MSRRLFSAAFVAAVVLVAPAHAGKTRAVRKTAPGARLVAGVITGTVVDAVTNQPVVFAKVETASDTDSTDKTGKFELKDVEGWGEIRISASRSGYELAGVSLTQGGDQTVTIKLKPTPTVRVVETDGTVHDFDQESIEFGYGVPFSGYREAPFDEFCKPDGTEDRIERSEMKKITGPATLVAATACCTDRQVQKINIQLRNGQTSDYFFSDSCNGYSVDVKGREHVSGKFLYIPFTEVAEIVFP